MKLRRTRIFTDSFPPPSELKTLYAKRWGIETSFGELKYAAGLVNFHAKKQEYIIQEIYARLTMYNFAEVITSHVVIQRTDIRLVYQLNFTVAIHTPSGKSEWQAYTIDFVFYFKDGTKLP